MDSQPREVPTLDSASMGVGDWPARGADLVETLVSLLRDKTVRPLTLIARALVFGVIVLAAATVTVVFVSISLIRILTTYVFDGRVWASDFVVGVLFVIIGLLAWNMRTDRKGGAESVK